MRMPSACRLFSASAVVAQTPSKTEVVGQPFVANLYLPACQGKCAVVLLVGGSGGGIDWQDYMGDILARHGFAAMALAYFGMPTLPKELDQIPLRSVEGTRHFLQQQLVRLVHGRERRLEVVGNGGKQLLLQPIELSQS